MGVALILPLALPAVQAAIETAPEIARHDGAAVMLLAAAIIRTLPAMSRELRAWVRLMRARR